tara:strand:+ start:175850 stop:176200 length:351 start_codon:yes stop_codon:yes gene_type:complete
VRETKISNCKLSFKCSKQWSSLTDKDINNQRYCDACKEDVYWCGTQEEIDTATSENRCVAFSVKPTGQITRWNSDEDGFLEFHMGRVEMPKDDTLESDIKDRVTSGVTSWLRNIFK